MSTFKPSQSSNEQQRADDVSRLSGTRSTGSNFVPTAEQMKALSARVLSVLCDPAHPLNTGIYDEEKVLADRAAIDAILGKTDTETPKP